MESEPELIAMVRSGVVIANVMRVGSDEDPNERFAGRSASQMPPFPVVPAPTEGAGVAEAGPGLGDEDGGGGPASDA